MTPGHENPAPLCNENGTVSCVWCGVAGPENHFQLTGPAGVRQNWACRQANLCALRAGGHDPVQVALRLVRELAQLHWQDVEARNALPAREQGGFRGQLTETARLRLHLVLNAASHRIRPQWGQGERQAQVRAEEGCRTCGAIGRDDCITVTGKTQVPRTHGTWGPRWHAGRTL